MVCYRGRRKLTRCFYPVFPASHKSRNGAHASLGLSVQLAQEELAAWALIQPLRVPISCLQREGRSGGTGSGFGDARLGPVPLLCSPGSRSPRAGSASSPWAGGDAALRPLGLSLGSPRGSSPGHWLARCVDAVDSETCLCSLTSQPPAGHFQPLRCPRGTLN